MHHLAFCPQVTESFYAPSILILFFVSMCMFGSFLGIKSLTSVLFQGKYIVECIFIQLAATIRYARDDNWTVLTRIIGLTVFDIARFSFISYSFREEPKNIVICIIPTIFSIISRKFTKCFKRVMSFSFLSKNKIWEEVRRNSVLVGCLLLNPCNFLILFNNSSFSLWERLF